MEGSGGTRIAVPAELDLRGLKCPLPAMKTSRALATMAVGKTLIVRATDPMSVIDIPHAAAKAGGRLMSRAQEGRVWVFIIEKGAGLPEQTLV